MGSFKRYLNKFLNFVIPGRRERILSKMMQADQDAGLYDDWERVINDGIEEDWDEDHALDMVLNSMVEDMTEEEIKEMTEEMKRKK